MLLMTATVGCKKGFLDINTSPNSVTPGSITPDLICPRAEHAMAATMATSYRIEAHWLGYWSRSGTYGPNADEESYNISSNFEAGEWSNWFGILNDLHIMEQKANASGEKLYEGIAKTLKTIGFMYLVDQYNNVPYTEAFDLGNHILPAYDKGQDIYNDLLVQLDDAQALIVAANPSTNANIAAADIIYGGDQTSWRKFINTQRLKLILRMSQVPSFNPSAVINKIQTDGSGFIGSGETASVQPGYLADNGKQNPFWDSYRLLYTGDVADQFNRANNYVLNKYRSNSDIRYQYFFQKAATPLHGNDYYGYNFGEVLPNDFEYKAANSSGVAGPGLAKSATQPQWLFTSVESMFMQAEAIQRGWLPGSAQSAYENAIRESFKWLGIPNYLTEANNYINQPGNTIVDWSTAASSTAKIQLIAMQQYLALCGVNNFEAWQLYRRLGVPTDLPPSMAPNLAGRHVPYRLQYPQDEFNYNAANVAAEGTINPQNDKIFWDQ